MLHPFRNLLPTFLALLSILLSVYSQKPLQADQETPVSTNRETPASNDELSTIPLSRAGTGQPVGFAWLKFFQILVVFFVWLRALQLCWVDGQDRQLQVDSWIKKLFGIGLVGIFAAILLPSYLVGGILLLATCIGPCWQYAHWRNEQVDDQTPSLGWTDFIGIPSSLVPTVTEVQLALSSSLAANPTDETITFVGKSFGERVTSGVEAGSGFELALNLLGNAVANSATDLHIGTKDENVAVRMRIEGEIVTQNPLSLKAGLSVINVFKVLSDLNITDKRRAQDGSFRANIGERRLYFRVASQGTNSGEKLSIRILDPAERFTTFEELGVNERMQVQLSDTLGRKTGLILFVGTSGAGKSTTAYAALRHIDSGERNIVTIEDPIEYSIPSIDQIEVRNRPGQSYEAGFRSVLRQDADVILIGEIRDEETAKVACQAAMTGQLVLSTLHGTNSTSAVLRLADLGVDIYSVSAALRAVVTQHLVRKLCVQCRTVYEPDDQMSQTLGLSDFDGVLFQRPDPLTNTCINCNGRGLLGRTGIFEHLEVTPSIRDLIRDRASTNVITNAAVEQGMVTLWEDGLRLVHDGIISPQELLASIEAP